MDGKDRFRRQDPRRSQPIRNAAHHLRMGEGSAQGPRQPDGTAPTLDTIISDAVGLGYQVIDEQIRQGRAAAECLRAGIRSPDDQTSDVSALVERTANLSMGLAATWLDLLSALGSALQQARPTPASTPPPPSTAPITEHEVNCPRRTEVDLHFNPDSDRFVPSVLPLHAADPKIPPLTGVFFTLSPDKRRAVLHIPVPDGQPPGTYSGAVVDAATNRPGGTLRVRILP